MLYCASNSWLSIWKDCSENCNSLCAPSRASAANPRAVTQMRSRPSSATIVACTHGTCSVKRRTSAASSEVAGVMPGVSAELLLMEISSTFFICSMRASSTYCVFCASRAVTSNTVLNCCFSHGTTKWYSKGLLATPGRLCRLLWRASGV